MPPEGEPPEQPPLPPGGGGDDPQPRRRYVVGNVDVNVVVERVQYLDENGNLLTESLTDYTRKAVRKAYATLSDFLTTWSHAERKQTVLEELAKQGVFLEELAEQVGHDLDPFDIVCHIAFDRPPLTRRERADKVKKRDIFGKYEAKARAVLDALLEKYADSGITSVESLDILKVDPLRTFGTPVEIVKLFGGKPAYLAALHELQDALYLQAA
jgi:type I restriction enzyme R subunit